MKRWRWLIKTPLLLVALSVALVTLLRWVPVRYTPVMLKRTIQFSGDGLYQSNMEWVPLEKISPELINAVVVAEDQRFYTHHGFDWSEIKSMWRAHRLEGAQMRGCSTLSQQTAKNVFTFGTPTIFRKVAEAYWTVLIELIWGKRRILEVYLNVAEMGRGLYGAEAASRYYYGVPAHRLDRKQAVSLAICLPQPLFLSPDCLGGFGKNRYKQLIETSYRYDGY